MKRMFTRRESNATQGEPVEVRRTAKGWKTSNGYYFADSLYTSVEANQNKPSASTSE
ncbi:hypothetical protein R2217_000777 [Cronobacter turicensis]|nr:hypothetical protein [Cronobacter turicensis]ELQ6074667.1 hypothetical protein [Cronobacter turicensis]ELQ6183747.1 hypothetical protein [Cronobacter turicensis]ELQ6234693.1 hypothetical protein [Cronobacter turicensis]ELQ6238573.1 hypothetical protein [Cronobacter turicensis]